MFFFFSLLVVVVFVFVVVVFCVRVCVFCVCVFCVCCCCILHCINRSFVLWGIQVHFPREKQVGQCGYQAA